MKNGTVKKSVSLPDDLWEFVEAEGVRLGHGMPSRVIQKAVREMRRNQARRKPEAAK